VAYCTKDEQIAKSEKGKQMLKNIIRQFFEKKNFFSYFSVLFVLSIQQVLHREAISHPLYPQIMRTILEPKKKQFIVLG
jgi:hypothetical protein